MARYRSFGCAALTLAAEEGRVTNAKDIAMTVVTSSTHQRRRMIRK